MTKLTTIHRSLSCPGCIDTQSQVAIDRPAVPQLRFLMSSSGWLRPWQSQVDRLKDGATQPILEAEIRATAPLSPVPVEAAKTSKNEQSQKCDSIDFRDLKASGADDFLVMSSRPGEFHIYDGLRQSLEIGSMTLRKAKQEAIDFKLKECIITIDQAMSDMLIEHRAPCQAFRSYALFRLGQDAEAKNAAADAISMGLSSGLVLALTSEDPQVKEELRRRYPIIA